MTESLKSICLTFTPASGHKRFLFCGTDEDLKAINSAINEKRVVEFKDSNTGFAYSYPAEVIVGVSSRPYEPKKGKKR